jgi:hypothetical protein
MLKERQWKLWQASQGVLTGISLIIRPEGIRIVSVDRGGHGSEAVSARDAVGPDQQTVRPGRLGNLVPTPGRVNDRPDTILAVCPYYRRYCATGVRVVPPAGQTRDGLLAGRRRGRHGCGQRVRCQHDFNQIRSSFPTEKMNRNKGKRMFFILDKNTSYSRINHKNEAH